METNKPPNSVVKLGVCVEIGKKPNRTDSRKEPQFLPSAFSSAFGPPLALERAKTWMLAGRSR